MARGWVLLDLANTNVFRAVHRPNPVLLGDRLDGFLTSLVADLLGFFPAGFWEFSVRLYDGWFDAAGSGTDLYNMIRSHLQRTYPIRGRRFRLFVEMALSPLATPEHRLIDTYREERGFRRYHMNVLGAPPRECHVPGACAVFHLRSWARGRCPTSDCLVSVQDVASYRQQKLVDTTLVADTVWLAMQGDAVVVVSEDEDVIPGLLTAKSFGGVVAWVCGTPQPRGPYLGVITNAEVGYIHANS
jgi:uncharacterized LabA/DUF88 family protein